MHSVHPCPSIKDLKSHQKLQKKISIYKSTKEEACSPLKPNTHTYKYRKLDNVKGPTFLAKMNPSYDQVPQTSTLLLFQILQPWSLSPSCRPLAQEPQVLSQYYPSKGHLFSPENVQLEIQIDVHVWLLHSIFYQGSPQVRWM